MKYSILLIDESKRESYLVEEMECDEEVAMITAKALSAENKGMIEVQADKDATMAIGWFENGSPLW